MADTDDWMNVSPFVSWWCRWKGHRPGPWRQSYQPHVEEQTCLRCGGWRCHTKDDVDMAPFNASSVGDQLDEIRRKVADSLAVRSMEPAADDIDCNAWVMLGVQRGWCSRPVCATHEGLPSTPDEDDQLEDGWDLCVYAVRLYEPEIVP